MCVCVHARVCACVHMYIFACLSICLSVCLSVCVLQIKDQSHSLLYVMISLRLVPVTPNWLLNILSPVLGVPLPLFFVSVLIGNVCTCTYVCMRMPFNVCVYNTTAFVSTRTSCRPLQFAIIVQYCLI